MVTDLITVKIKLTDEKWSVEEKTEKIKEAFKSIVNHLEETKGNVQQAKMKDENLFVEYVHVRNQR